MRKFLIPVFAVVFVSCGNDVVVDQKDEKSNVESKTQKEAIDEVSPSSELDSAEQVVQEDVTEKEVVQEDSVESIEIAEDIETIENKEVNLNETADAIEKQVEEEAKEIKPVKNHHNHDSFDALLNKYVSPDGKVNYKGIKTEQTILTSYIDSLAKYPPKDDWTRNQKLAYYINIYNANTIALILKNYPLESITKIDKAWDTPFFKMGDKTYSLNDVENKIVRPTFNEPRIHFAMNCAAESCPKLPNYAFTAERLEGQLEARAEKFINDAVSNQVTETSVSLSKIFEWYGDDFKKGQTLIEFINKYSKTKANATATVSFNEYNWNLNE